MATTEHAPTAPLTTIDQLTAVLTAILEEHFTYGPTYSPDEAPGFRVRQDTMTARSGIGSIRSSCRFDGMHASVALFIADDGLVGLSMSVLPNVASYATVLLPEDVTADRIARHAAFAAKRMHARVEQWRADRAADTSASWGD